MELERTLSECTDRSSPFEAEVTMEAAHPTRRHPADELSPREAKTRALAWLAERLAWERKLETLRTHPEGLATHHHEAA